MRRDARLVPSDPVQIREIEANGGIFFLDPPLCVLPCLEADSQQFLIAEIPDLDLFVAGQTRDGLLEDFAAQLAFVWREYALAEEEDLTEDARSLRKRLLNIARWEKR
jgi:hypothetical protein